MRTLIAMTAGLISMGIAGITPAAAFHLSPSGDFVGTGKTSATKSGLTLPCKAKFTGHVDDSGVGFVDGGTFKDVQGGFGCAGVQLSNLPWEVDAITRNHVQIKGVAFSTPIGDCGPGDVEGTIKNGILKMIAVHLDPDCTVSAHVLTNPIVSIVK